MLALCLEACEWSFTDAFKFPGVFHLDLGLENLLQSRLDQHVQLSIYVGLRTWAEDQEQKNMLHVQLHLVIGSI